MSRWLKTTVLTVILAATMVVTTQGQISVPRPTSTQADQFTRLQDQLINRLRATTADKKAYVRRLVKLVKDGKLELKLVLGLERAAIRRRSTFPFPYFERAMKVEAGKRGVTVLTVKEFEAANTRITR